MESEKRKRGRPPKNGIKDVPCLARALLVLHAYEKARSGGLKHSSAVRDAVTFVQQLNPKIPISETEVRRILAELRPSDSPIALMSSYALLEGEEAVRLRNRFAQMLASDRGINQISALGEDPARPLKMFSIYMGKRRNYPRQNAKRPSQ